MESEEEDKLIAGQIGGQNQALHSIQKAITKMSNSIELNNKMNINNEESLATKFSHTVSRRVESKIDGLRETFDYISTSGEEDNSEFDDSTSENLRMLSDKSTPNVAHSKPYSQSSAVKHNRMRISVNYHDESDIRMSEIDIKGLRKNHKSVHVKRGQMHP